MTIHREGKATIIISVVAVIVLNVAVRYFAPDITWLKITAIVASIFLLVTVLQFFRKPNRTTTLNAKYVLAPADGKVVVVEETHETEYFDEPRKQVSIFMSPINVHQNFNPISGIVSYFKYHPGKYLVAWHPKSSTDNERTTVVIKHSTGTEILFRQIAGAMARRICWYVDKGQKVTQGDEFGFIKFGSRVDIYLPLNARINVGIDDKTVGGQTVIAEL